MDNLDESEKKMGKRKSHASLSLNGVWRFTIDPLDHGISDKWYQEKYSDGDWFKVAVPGAWDCYRTELNGYEGVAWYRRNFVLQKSGTRRHVTLRFQGVSHACEVWVNGRMAGNHEGGHTAFELDVSSLAKPGSNSLVLRVENIPSQDRVPQKSAGWWHYGGILRGVDLVVRGELHIERSAIDCVATPDFNGGRIVAHVQVVNKSSVPACTLVVAELDSHGKILSSGNLKVPALGTADQILDLTCLDVQLWSPDSPKLYRLRIKLMDSAGKLLDGQEFRVGFRTLDVNRANIRLNGRPIKLLGVNYHEQYPGTGPTGTESQVRKDLALVKEMGANFVRAAHYPHQPLFYDLCDELGLLVMDEIPLWQVAVPGTKVTASSMGAVRRTAMQQVAEMVYQNRHHPCVAIWSVGNENSPFRKDVASIISGLMREVRRLDSTRLVTYVTAPWNNNPPWYSEETPLDEVDILCFNEYFGFMHGEAWKGVKFKALRPEEIAVKALPRLGQALDWAEKRYPGKPILISEMGEEGLRGSPGCEKGSERFQAECMKQHLNFILQRKIVAGAVIWCLTDYLMHRRCDQPMPGSGFFTFPFGLMGLLDFERRTKLSYHAVKNIFKHTAKLNK